MTDTPTGQAPDTASNDDTPTDPPRTYVRTHADLTHEIFEVLWPHAKDTWEALMEDVHDDPDNTPAFDALFAETEDTELPDGTLLTFGEAIWGGRLGEQLRLTIATYCGTRDRHENDQPALLDRFDATPGQEWSRNHSNYVLMICGDDTVTMQLVDNDEQPMGDPVTIGD